MSEIGLKKTALDTPILWVDLDLLERNIETIANYFREAGVHWRPHVKGVKIPAIAHKLLAAGAIGVTCAKLGEAEVMVAGGIHDILIANQVVGSRKITRLVHLRRQADVKVAVDSEANVIELGQAAQATGVELGLLIEVDTGMQRVGVPPGQAVVELASKIAQTPGVQFLGLMAWEGHTLWIEGPAEKQQAIEKAVSLLTDSARLCEEAGLPVSIVSGGGTGTYKITPHLPGITEMQAGGVIFNDVLYQKMGAETTPALFVQTVVTSRPTPERVIFDAGYKTLPRWHADPQPVGIQGVKSYGASAEHGILTLEQPNSSIRAGDLIDIQVGYTDSTLFLHNHLYGIRAGVVEAVWEIQARGKLR